jgi:hypothetical protein
MSQAIERFMVCASCLKAVYGGWEKCCTHGWDFETGKPRPGTCSECKQPALSLHCPDGPKRAIPAAP